MVIADCLRGGEEPDGPPGAAFGPKLPRVTTPPRISTPGVVDALPLPAPERPGSGETPSFATGFDPGPEAAVPRPVQPPEELDPVPGPLAMLAPRPSLPIPGWLPPLGAA